MIGQLTKKQRPVFFESDSWKRAAVDVYLAAHIAPRSWPLEKRQAVIRHLRRGEDSSVVAREQRVDQAQVEKLRKLVRTVTTVEQLIRAQGGVVAVEFAIIAPVLILLVMGGLNYGMAAFTQSRMQFAAEGASRCGGLGQCPTVPATIAYAAEQAQVGSFQATETVCGVQVTGSYNFNLISLFPATPISVSACYPKSAPS